MRKSFFVALALLLTSCSNGAGLADVSITQDSVSAVTLETRAKFSVSRVVSLANGVAEIMNSLNAKSILVGRDVASTEDALKDVPVVTSGHQVISEKVIALKPDVVLIDASTGPKAALDQIKAAGITVIQIPESWTLDDIPTKVRAVGVAIGALAQAEVLISRMKETLLKVSVKGSPKVAFLYLRGTSSVYLIGGPGSGADSLLQTIGAIDVGAQSLPNPFNTMTAESLATLNPDVILVMSKGLQSVGGVDGLIELPGVAQTNAGKNRAVVDVDDSLLLSFGPRTPSLVAALAAAIDRANS